VIPFATGGTAEIIARSVVASLTYSLGQSVYVDNKPGGAGNIAMEEIKRANPDGHTLILGQVPTLEVNPTLFEKNYHMIQIKILLPLLWLKEPLSLKAFGLKIPGQVTYIKFIKAQFLLNPSNKLFFGSSHLLQVH